MFKRRKSIGIFEQVRKFVWPERGFRRLFIYLTQRVKRMPGTPASIATGLACGVAVSFTPFLGFHLLLGAFLAYLMRGNLIASGIGTAVGNPWTFPFIFLANYELGLWLMGVFGVEVQRQSMNLSEFSSDPSALLFPLMLGGLTMGVLSWIASFGMAFWAVTEWREHRAKRMEASRQRRSKKRVNRNYAANDTSPVSSSSGLKDDDKAKKRYAADGGKDD